MENCSSCCKQNTSDRGPPYAAESLNLLLMGKTGEGKSATGNSILGQKIFASSADFTAETVVSRKEVTQMHDGTTVHVVDTPGVADTGLSEKEGKKMFARAIKEAIAICPDGYDAFLLTIRFGSRLTGEHIQMTPFLKQLFGDNFLRDYGIIIVTCGDRFSEDEDVDYTFKEWCQRQTGHFNTLYREVNGRVVLFNNKGRPDIKESQRQELINTVVQLKAVSGRYTDPMFAEVKKQYERLNRQRVYVRVDILDETSLILALMEKVADKKGWVYVGDKKFNFEKLQKMVGSLKTRLEMFRDQMPDDIMKETLRILSRAHEKMGDALEYATAVENQNLQKDQANRWLEKIKKEVDVLVQEFRNLKNNMKRAWYQRIYDFFTLSTLDRTIFGRIGH